MELNDKLKSRRLEIGLTLEEVAALVGVSKPTIFRYESGEITNIKLSMVAKMAKALKTSPEYLMGWDSPLIADKMPYARGRSIPIIGAIHAGAPALAVENIEGYDYADVPEGEDYFFLLRQPQTF